jgi:hypothetical protein
LLLLHASVALRPATAHLLHVLLHLEVLPVHKDAVIAQQRPVLPASRAGTQTSGTA